MQNASTGPSVATPARPLRVRWLGTVPYREAFDLQHALFERGADDWLLLLEHTPVYTLGARADMANVLVDPASVGAELVRADRGGDVTYHGPGQLVGYPILTVPGKRGGGMADTVAYVRSVEQLVIDTLTDLGLPDVGRLHDYPGVWVAPESERPRKIAAWTQHCIDMLAEALAAADGPASRGILTAAAWARLLHPSDAARPWRGEIAALSATERAQAVTAFALARARLLGGDRPLAPAPALEFRPPPG